MQSQGYFYFLIFFLLLLILYRGARLFLCGIHLLTYFPYIFGAEYSIESESRCVLKEFPPSIEYVYFIFMYLYIN